MTNKMPMTRHAVLIIRAWLEPDQDNAFRARMIAGDPADPSSTVAVSNLEDLLAAVTEWLSGFVASGDQ